ncbi:MAG: hypothetical protein AAFQ43_01580 [Bacteroidota bacterium]
MAQTPARRFVCLLWIPSGIHGTPPRPLAPEAETEPPPPAETSGGGDRSLEASGESE